MAIGLAGNTLNEGLLMWVAVIVNPIISLLNPIMFGFMEIKYSFTSCRHSLKQSGTISVNVKKLS
jgi:hypothetical protein